MAEMMGDHCVTAELLGRTLKPAESTVRDSTHAEISPADLGLSGRLNSFLLRFFQPFTSVKMHPTHHYVLVTIIDASSCIIDTTDFTDDSKFDGAFCG